MSIEECFKIFSESDINSLDITNFFREDSSQGRVNENATIPLEETDYNNTAYRTTIRRKYTHEEQVVKNKIEDIKPLYVGDKTILSEHWNKVLNKKRRENKDNENKEIENIEIKENKKRGRKKNTTDPFDDNTDSNHDRYSQDNIIKNIKSKLINNTCRIFLNIILSIETGSNNLERLKKLDYKIINSLKKENELQILGKTLKDLYSSDISSKFTHAPKDANKIYIDNVLSHNPSETTKFILGLKFRDWLNIFTYHNDLDKYILTNPDVNFELIKKHFIRGSYLYNEIKKENDTDYSDLFLWHLHNYERYFMEKKERNISKSKMSSGSFGFNS